MSNTQIVTFSCTDIWSQEHCEGTVIYNSYYQKVI